MESLLACAQDAAKGRPLPLSILALALDNTFLSLAWRIHALEGAASPSAAAAAALGKAAASFGAQLDQIGAVEAGAQALQEAIARTQADLFIIFSADKLKAGLDHCPPLLASRMLERDPPRPRSSPFTGDNFAPSWVENALHPRHTLASRFHR